MTRSECRTHAQNPNPKRIIRLEVKNRLETLYKISFVPSCKLQ